MTRFFNDTLQDMRAGRESWRVFTTFAVLALSLSFMFQIV